MIMLKKGTSALYCWAIEAISESSVETTTLLTHRDFNATSIVHAIKGFPARGLMFFRGTFLEPPLAGIITNISLSEVLIRLSF